MSKRSRENKYVASLGKLLALKLDEESYRIVDSAKKRLMLTSWDYTSTLWSRKASYVISTKALSSTGFSPEGHL